MTGTCPIQGLAFRRFSHRNFLSSLLGGNHAEIGRWFYLILLCTLSQYFPFHMVVIWPNFPPWQALKKWRMPSLFHIQISKIWSCRPPFPLMTPWWAALVWSDSAHEWPQFVTHKIRCENQTSTSSKCALWKERVFEEWERSERQEMVLIGIRELS